MVVVIHVALFMCMKAFHVMLADRQEYALKTAASYVCLNAYKLAVTDLGLHLSMPHLMLLFFSL